MSVPWEHKFWVEYCKNLEVQLQTKKSDRKLKFNVLRIHTWIKLCNYQASVSTIIKANTKHRWKMKVFILFCLETVWQFWWNYIKSNKIVIFLLSCQSKAIWKLSFFGNVFYRPWDLPEYMEVLEFVSHRILPHDFFCEIKEWKLKSLTCSMHAWLFSGMSFQQKLLPQGTYQ